MLINHLKAELKINASASRVWQIVGHEFAEIERWSSGIGASRAATEGKKPEGCDISGRYCDNIQEELTHYSDEKMRFGYVMVNPPFFLKSIGNNWQVREVGLDQSIVEFQPEIECSFGWWLILAPLVRVGGPWMANRVLDELKYYVETGEPHPRKAKALSRATA
ncbi:MAG: SRPBCC family protein [Chloroflexota bacterium]